MRVIGNWHKWIVWLVVALALVGGYWLLPIHGQVIVTAQPAASTLLWPRFELDPAVPQPGQQVTVSVTDAVPWANVVLTVDGRWVRMLDWRPNPGNTWTWRWSFVASDTPRTLAFYHSCDAGCLQRGQLVLGAAQPPTPAHLTPTKLGAVFASPDRNWHGRSGWDVEVTYARLASRDYWGVDDLATRVQQANARGLRVLVRVDYAQGQSIPPTNDYVALSEYLDYLRRLARDRRLSSVYGYIVGSGFNTLANNAASSSHAVTPEWYARLFNGYGEAVTHEDNAVQVVRSENPQVRLLAGTVEPWNSDQNGSHPYSVNVPWLNYMNTLVAALDEGARAKAEASINLVSPDGFALQAPGRLGANALGLSRQSAEPSTDLHQAPWGQAQAGFRVYRDWLAIINGYDTTRGLPAFITSTNTYAPDEKGVPAQNYVRGWLTSALSEINAEPQVQALCWFLDDDRTGDTRWDLFSLSRHPGRMIDAADEFDSLLVGSN